MGPVPTVTWEASGRHLTAISQKAYLVILISIYLLLFFLFTFSWLKLRSFFFLLPVGGANDGLKVFWNRNTKFCLVGSVKPEIEATFLKINCCHGENYGINYTTRSPYDKWWNCHENLFSTRYGISGKSQEAVLRAHFEQRPNLSTKFHLSPFNSRWGSRRVVNSQQRKYQPDWFKAARLIHVNAEVCLQREITDTSGMKSPLNQCLHPSRANFNVDLYRFSSVNK